jgi:hypothetical protein
VSLFFAAHSLFEPIDSGIAPGGIQSEPAPSPPIEESSSDPPSSSKPPIDALATKQDHAVSQSQEAKVEGGERGPDSGQESGSSTSDSALALSERHELKSVEGLKKWWAKKAQVDDDDDDDDSDDDNGDNGGDDDSDCSGDTSSDNDDLPRPGRVRSGGYSSSTNSSDSSFHPPTTHGSKTAPSNLLSGMRPRRAKEPLNVWPDGSVEEGLLADELWNLVVAIPKDGRAEKVRQIISMLRNGAPSGEPSSEGLIRRIITKGRKRKRVATDSDCDSVMITRATAVVSLISLIALILFLTIFT